MVIEILHDSTPSDGIPVKLLQKVKTDILPFQANQRLFLVINLMESRIMNEVSLD
jgi:hypothetical protein